MYLLNHPETLHNILDSKEYSKENDKACGKQRSVTTPEPLNETQIQIQGDIFSPREINRSKGQRVGPKVVTLKEETKTIIQRNSRGWYVKWKQSQYKHPASIKRDSLFNRIGYYIFFSPQITQSIQLGPYFQTEKKGYTIQLTGTTIINYLGDPLQRGRETVSITSLRKHLQRRPQPQRKCVCTSNTYEVTH